MQSNLKNSYAKSMLKRILITIYKWFAVDLLRPHHKKWVKKKAKRILPIKLLKFIQRFFNQEQDARHKKIESLRRRMLNLGLFEKAYHELQTIVNIDGDNVLKKMAAWELAQWHANQYTKQDASSCLELLSIVEKEETDPSFLRQILVLKVESLAMIGKVEDARKLLSNQLTLSEDANLYLAAANLETKDEKRLCLINKVLQKNGIADITRKKESQASFYDSIYVSDVDASDNKENPKVTVIVPAYNAGTLIKTALDSIINQTWTNLEVLVVDDCSKDNTTSIVNDYVKKDKRIQLLKAEQNGGPYVARNLALKIATGDFVTCHDADDWCHPSKIEIQVNHLLKNPSVVGNTSEQVRATDEMEFYRRGKPGFYIFDNMSSFLFRRTKVMDAIGYWDSVRFGADSEFIRRVIWTFGEKSVVNLKTGPLAFQRQGCGSLTASSSFGYHGFFMGARKEYFEAFNEYHKSTSNLKFEFPLTKRKFEVPEPMWPIREKKAGERRHFDVIIASDFRLDGGSNLSNVEEIKAQKKLGVRTGLVQMYRYDYNYKKTINPKIRDLLDGNDVQMLVYGEKVSCDLLIVRYPPILQEKQCFIPDVKAKDVRVIINQTPFSDYGTNPVLRYGFSKSQENLEKYFQEKATWHPIGPLVRETLEKHHKDELPYIHLSPKDWVNIIDVKSWRRTDSKRNRKPIIGRHSRDAEVKWPNDREELLAIYPATSKFDIHVLGGADTPRNVLGKLPRNWKVFDFGEIEAKQFLSTLDVFVYYTHPNWVESFGRVIIEAMAVGVPVILPQSYKVLFGEAAIYAEPKEVEGKINELLNNPSSYEKQVEVAWQYVDKHFGYSMHASRIGKERSQSVVGDS